jgi:Transglycosylase SLT domain
MQVTPNSAAPHVTGAIQQAATSTGTSFDYLLATAQIESNLNPSAQASTSSAQGLFQFIDQTWLGTMKRSGASLGLARFSDAIVQGQDGRFDVPDAGMRDAIMKMRTNPRISAMMAGAYASNNAAQLTDGLGRAPSEGELYIAHFLGLTGPH